MGRFVSWFKMENVSEVQVKCAAAAAAAVECWDVLNGTLASYQFCWWSCY